MARHRDALPQASGSLFITDGGIETTLIFHDRIPLPYFAAFHLLANAQGRDALRRYFRTYAALAKRYGVGYILESATWRASPDWGAKLNYSTEALIAANRQAIAMLLDIREEYEDQVSKMVVSGCIGPRGDGYNPTVLMNEDDAQRYHSLQMETFRNADADMVTAITMTYPAEAIGVARAARAAGMPVAISFTVETDGCLPTGETLGKAIERVDTATDHAPQYYMINCAHPMHFAGALTGGGAWVGRVRGLRANASTKSHAELNEATKLDDGNPKELGLQHRKLRRQFPHLNILGGCCGTDQRHIEEICRACLQLWGERASVEVHF